jgi:hypothetical protein
VSSEEGIAAAVEALGGYEAGLYAEKWVPFVCELAVMVVRSRDGSLASFPVVQTIHKDSILWTTETPARVPPAAQRRVQEVAEQAVAALEGASSSRHRMLNGMVVRSTARPWEELLAHSSLLRRRLASAWREPQRPPCRPPPAPCPWLSLAALRCRCWRVWC